MKRGRKALLLIVAVICLVAGIAHSARLLVSSFHAHSQAKLVRGLGDGWDEDMEDTDEAADTEEDRGQEAEPGADEESADVAEEDQAMYGVMEGNCYSNEWFRFRVELPESYLVLSGDEFEYAQGIGADQCMTEEGKDRLEAAKDYGSVRYVMAAYEESGSMSVNIGIERMLSKSMTVEQYLNLAQKSLENDMSEELGLTFEGITEETVAGETYHCLHEKMVYAGAQEMQMDQYVRIEDGYAMVMSIGYGADTAAKKDEFLALIQGY